MTLIYPPDYDLVQSIFRYSRPSKAVHFFLHCILKVLFINNFVPAVCLLFMSRCSSNKWQMSWLCLFCTTPFASLSWHIIFWRAGRVIAYVYRLIIFLRIVKNQTYVRNISVQTSNYFTCLTTYYAIILVCCNILLSRTDTWTNLQFGVEKNLNLILKRTGAQLKVTDFVRSNNIKNKFLFGAALFHQRLIFKIYYFQFQNSNSNIHVHRCKNRACIKMLPMILCKILLPFNND